MVLDSFGVDSLKIALPDVEGQSAYDALSIPPLPTADNSKDEYVTGLQRHGNGEVRKFLIFAGGRGKTGEDEDEAQQPEGWR
jgi:hypothetical protein